MSMFYKLYIVFLMSLGLLFSTSSLMASEESKQEPKPIMSTHKVYLDEDPSNVLSEFPNILEANQSHNDEEKRLNPQDKGILKYLLTSIFSRVLFDGDEKITFSEMVAKRPVAVYVGIAVCIAEAPILIYILLQIILSLIVILILYICEIFFYNFWLVCLPFTIFLGSAEEEETT